ncbi:unnamed protein product [Closterium sp. NIES-54]
MVDRLPALSRGAAPALQKGDLPTQQVDGVPTLQQSDCPTLPRRRQQCTHSQMRADDWPDLHRCAFVGCCLRLTSHIDFGIPPRSRLRHRDLDDVCVLRQNSPRSSLVDSNTSAVPCSSTKPVEQLSHCGWSAATPVHPTKLSALPKRGRGQRFTPVNTAGARGAGGSGGAGGATRAAGTGGAGGTAGARGAGATIARGAAGVGGATGAAGAVGDGAAGAGGAGAAFLPRADCFYTRSRSYLSQPHLLLGSMLPAPAPHTEVTESLNERHEPETRASTPVRACLVARPRPPAIPHGMTLRPSSVPQRVVLHEPPASSLLHVHGPESDLARAASPIVTFLLATVVTDPDFEFTAAFTLVTELVDIAAMRCLDYVASLITESESVCPPSVGGEPALRSDILQDRQFELECLAAA